MSKGFTTIKELDYQILSQMHSKDLIHACQTNKTLHKYCNDMQLWENKLIEEGYYFIREYPQTTLGWITLFDKLNQARANRDKAVLICKILSNKDIDIKGPKKMINNIIYAYFYDEAKGKYGNDIIYIVDKTLIINPDLGPRYRIKMSQDDIDYLLLIAYYYETFNVYEKNKDEEDYLLITNRSGIPFIIGKNTHHYIDSDAYYDKNYQIYDNVGKAIDYMQNNYHCVPK